MNEDKFLMWKLALSVIHFDGKVTEEEKSWFEKKIVELDNNKLLNFTDEQVDILRKTLETPVENFVAEFENLKNPANASFLLHMIRTISHADGEFSPEEKEMFSKIETAISLGIDYKEVTDKIEQIQAETEKEMGEEKVYNRHSMFERTFKSLINLL